MKSRNNNLDILKIVLAFLVVALHIFPVYKIKGWQGLISYEISSGITRIAVPTFFLISGYFLRNKLNDTAYLWKYAKRILLLYFVWQLIYLPDLIRFYNLGWFSTFDMVLKLVYGYWHLWYLLATVLAMGLLYSVKHLSVKAQSLIILFFFLIGYGYQILYQSNLGFLSSEGRLVYEIMGTTRNFLFFAFPMMLLGTLYDKWKGLMLKIKKTYILLWILLLVEVYFYYSYKIKAMDFLLSLPLLSMLTFYWVNEAPSVSQRIFNPSFSLGIYLVHPYAIRLVYEFLPQKTFDFIVLKYILIVLVAILFWWVIDKINKKVPYLL